MVNEYICIYDTYFKKQENNDTWCIDDEELAHLIAVLRKNENERDYLKYKVKRQKEVFDKSVERLEHEKHVYKVELGRCVRKLTRLYRTIFKYGTLNYILNRSEVTGKELVDIFKGL